MKHIFFLFLMLLATSLSFSQSNMADCNNFKTGDFTYLDSSTNLTWKIVRGAKHQTEKNEKEGIVIKKKIRWISACEYQLTQTWTNSKKLRTGNFKSLNYMIIPVNDNSYRFSCNCGDGTKTGGIVQKRD